MKIHNLNLEGVALLTPTIYHDSRGSFSETFNSKMFNSIVGKPTTFVQDNFSISHKNVLRGLHYQLPNEQGKLVRVLKGTIYDVIVDIRKDSETFGKWEGVELTNDGTQLWIPSGFAHGFLALTDDVHFMYKVTDYYTKNSEHCIRWDDPTLAINWPINNPIVSDKDSIGKLFNEAVF